MLRTKAKVNPDQTLIQQANIAMQKLKDIQDHQGWIHFSDKPCKMFKMHIGNRLLSKGQIYINLPMKEILDRLSDENIMKDLNSQLKEIKTIHRFKAGQNQGRVNYMRYKGVWPVQDRDFVNVSVKQEQQNMAYIASMVSTFAYPAVEKVTRATCHIAGYILKKIQEQFTLLIYISDVDLSGSIPQIFKNKLSQLQAGMPKQIERVLMGIQNNEQELENMEQTDMNEVD